MKLLMSVCIALMTSMAAGAEITRTAGLDTELVFNIPSQPLEMALLRFSEQASIQVLMSSKEIPNRRAEGLIGTFSVRKALERLLKGTGLTFEQISETTVAISAGAKTLAGSSVGGWPNGANSRAESARTVPVRVADSGNDSPSAVEANASTRRNDEPVALETVVVTGTHIRGVAPASSPLTVYTRDEIERIGAGSLEAFVQRLPQNFGDASQTSGTAIQGGSGFTLNNRVGGSGVNLRGLGADSTLVLINGRRVSQGNTRSNFVDISLIPLNAVERLEVVADGASAIYGSDAVGGVINFIMRDDFEGAETTARFGSVTNGGRQETQVGQSFGSRWSSGSALITYEYLEQTSLDARSRSYSESALRPFSLLPEQERHGAFAKLDQDLGDGVSAFAYGSYGQRSTSSDFASAVFFEHDTARVENYGATAGLRVALTGDGQLELSATYGESEATTTATQRTATAVFQAETLGQASTLSVDGIITGSLFDLPAGAVGYALGAQYREETHESVNLLTSIAFRPAREVMAGFVEFRLPLLAGAASDPSRPRLELSAADRYEEYSDFGSTNNPRVGLTWRPWTAISLRGTYGTSFKAPGLNDVNPSPRQAVFTRLFDPSIGSVTNTLFVAGGNAGLEPEEATTWTAGLDLRPQRLPGLKASLTYYDVRYDDRIATPSTIVPNIANLIRNEALLGPTVIIRNPSLSLVQGFTSSASQFLNPFAIDPSTIRVIADTRLQNLSAVTTTGVDFALSYTTTAGFGTIETGVDGTKLLKFDNKVTSISPTVEILDTPYNPLDLRLRARASLTRGSMSASLFVNYVDSYRSVTPLPADIDSWTTADAALSYQSGSSRGLLSDLWATVGVLNITDEDPPFVSNQAFPIFFDGANANPLGRFAYIRLSKGW